MIAIASVCRQWQHVALSQKVEWVRRVSWTLRIANLNPLFSRQSFQRLASCWIQEWFKSPEAIRLGEMSRKSIEEKVARSGRLYKWHVYPMPPLPPTFDSETSQLISSTRRRETDLIEVQIPRLRTCLGPLSLQQRLSAELREDIDVLSRQIEVTLWHPCKASRLKFSQVPRYIGRRSERAKES